jgi:Sulfatase
MLARLILATLFLIVAAPPDTWPAGPSRIPPEVQHRMAEIPPPLYHANRPPDLSAPRLRRTFDLLPLLWDGQGTFRPGHGAAPRLYSALSVQALPWATAWPQASKLVTRSFGPLDQEAALSLVLFEHDRWCAPPLDLEPGSRLRFEAVSLDAARAARLRVSLQGGSGELAPTLLVGTPASVPVPPQSDVPLPPGRAAVCFDAAEGTVSVGEPRLLAPEPPGADPRPRWVIVVVHDALRGDVVTRPNAERVVPTLLRLARGGLRYDRAVSPGANTLAATFPLFTGRDLSRVDPLLAMTPVGTPLSVVFTRGNLFVSQLAQDAGYHSVFLGNNSFLRGVPVFARSSNHGRSDTGTTDMVAVLPSFVERYADERVFFIYWVSAPHAYSFTPRRLYDQLGCTSLEGMAAVRCAYDARARHSDEALEALEVGLSQQGLDGSSLQVITADHGEVLGDGREMEIQSSGRWRSTVEGHGATTHWNELHVPLVVSGPGIPKGAFPDPVSLLDLVPTLAHLAGLPAPERLDGEVLPLLGGPRVPAAQIVSQGYCSDSVLEGARQLIRWEVECPRRPLGGGTLFAYNAELWEHGRLVATDVSDPRRVDPLVRAHLRWLATRLPGEVILLDPAKLGRARVSVTTPGGRIVDWGPSGSVTHLDTARSTLAEEGREIRIDFAGGKSLFYVATWPPRTPFRVDVQAEEAGPPVTFVGPLQLPLSALGREIDPSEHGALWLAAVEPDREPSPRPSLRIWRQPYRSSERAPVQALNELDRVLREWGYIR